MRAAKEKLQSNDLNQRLDAIDILENNLAELDVKNINQLYLNEKNNKVKARLAQLKARLDYQNPDVLQKMTGGAKCCKILTVPMCWQWWSQELQQANLHPELKAALTEAKSNIKTRIQASEWTGHVFQVSSTASILLLGRWA